MTDLDLAALIAENKGLRSSVAMYKRRAQLANTRADETENRLREIEKKANKLTVKLANIRRGLQILLEITGEDMK